MYVFYKKLINKSVLKTYLVKFFGGDSMDWIKELEQNLTYFYEFIKCFTGSHEQDPRNQIWSLKQIFLQFIYKNTTRGF